MKKYYVLIILILCALVFVSCSSIDENIEKPEGPALTNTDQDILSMDENSDQTVDEDLSDLAGTYFYDYEGDTPDLIEDHYIVIEMTEDKIIGYYYGTSDDFDAAREGYLPGFYVAQMVDLNMDQDSIDFSIKVYPKDVFESPVELKYRRVEDMPSNENAQWINAHIFDENNGLVRSYEGKVEDENIVINTEQGIRVFRKIVK